MKKAKVVQKVESCLLLSAVILGVAGCGNSNGITTKQGIVAEAGNQTGSTPNGVTTVKVGTGTGAAPFCYLDEDGKSVGYDLDVLAEVDKRLEAYEFQIEAMDFSTLIVSIDSGAIDMISHQLVKSEARKQKYIFPEQYYCLSPMSLAVKADSGITGMGEMAGKTMDQNPSAYEYQMLLAYNAEHPDGEIIINAVSDQTTADTYKKVSNGQVDAALTYQATYESVMTQLGISNMVLTDVVMCEDTYMMFAKDETELCERVNEALESMIADGTLTKISEKWFGEDVINKYADMITVVPD